MSEGNGGAGGDGGAEDIRVETVMVVWGVGGGVVETASSARTCHRPSHITCLAPLDDHLHVESLSVT